MSKIFFLSVLFFLFIGAVCAEEIGLAVETEEVEQAEDEIFNLEDMEVKERLSGGNLGKTEIPRELLQNMPKSDGTVSDLLRTAPSVQYDLNYRSSSTAGEIEPAGVSISGGKPYENLFLIDGLNNSNTMGAGGYISIQDTDTVEGNPQKFFIDSWLIEDITLYDTNISAAYGDFTGGVVEVKTKNPSGKFGGNLSYRTTRSGWSHYYVDERDREYFNKSDTPDLQPSFRKDFYTASLSIPINADTGFLASYNRTDSIIPLGYFKDYRDTERISETYFLKLLRNIDGSSYIEASAAYSPYAGKYFLQDTMDGDFEINGGGWLGIANYHLETEGGGEIKLHADYSFQENSRTKSKDYHMAWIASKLKPWGAGADEDYSKPFPSYEGGPGNVENENGAFALKFAHRLGEISLAGAHELHYGVAYNYIFGRHQRPTPYTYYIDATASLIVDCNGDTLTCVDADQYFATKNYFPVSDVYVYINEYAAYLEDEWKFSRLKLRAGGRLSGDDYLNNINFAPRTQLQWDIFDDNATLITIGYARYYSANLLANKLREGMLPKIETVRWLHNNKVTPWMPTDTYSVDVYNFRELKTPYTDEYTAAAEQKISASILGLKWTERHARDEFASDREVVEKDGFYHRRLNNNGSSDYRSVQLKWEKGWKNHIASFNASWSESSTSNDNYDEDYGLEDMEKDVIYNGETIKRKDLPKDNFNRPFVFNLSYVGKFFNHLTASGILKYTTSHKKQYSQNMDTGIELPDGDTYFISVYRTVELDDMLTLDCTLSWEQKVYKDHKIIVTLEVLNLFDAKNKIGEDLRNYYKGSYEYNEYQMGRQFWAGIAYEF
jgi:hypothetical protein